MDLRYSLLWDYVFSPINPTTFRRYQCVNLSSFLIRILHIFYMSLPRELERPRLYSPQSSAMDSLRKNLPLFSTLLELLVKSTKLSKKAKNYAIMSRLLHIAQLRDSVLIPLDPNKELRNSAKVKYQLDPVVTMDPKEI